MLTALILLLKSKDQSQFNVHLKVAVYSDNVFIG